MRGVKTAGAPGAGWTGRGRGIPGSGQGILGVSDFGQEFPGIYGLPLFSRLYDPGPHAGGDGRDVGAAVLGEPVF